MKKLPIFIILMMFAVLSYSSNDNNNSASDHITLQNNENIFWINSLKMQCVGVSKMQCLQIQKGIQLDLDNNGWELFYDSIEGFNYEQGFIYKIIVKEESIPSNKIAADASSKKYTLVKVLEKQLDSKMTLHNIWSLKSIQGQEVQLAGRLKRPYLEINLQEMKIMGNDSCNNFSGSIQKVDSEKLILGKIAVTRKMCIKMDIANRFDQTMNTIENYIIKDMKLYLFNKNGDELFVFQKID